MIEKYVLSLPGDWYNVNILTATSGSVSVDKNLGKTSMSATLTPIPDTGAMLSGYEVTGGTINRNVLTFGSSDVIIQPYFKEYVPPAIPEDTLFIYLADDFDGSKIPNKVTAGTDMGPYLANGTLNKNGTGANCYLSQGSSYSHLYIENSIATRNLMRADNSPFTYFFRVVTRTGGTGGIICWRCNINSGPGNNYCYMIRCDENQVNIHTDQWNELGEDFSLTSDNVYKIVVNGFDYYGKNLTTNATTSFHDVSTKGMSTKMISIAATEYGDEADLNEFYGIAGVARETTSEEDELMKNILMNQSI